MQLRRVGLTALAIGAVLLAAGSTAWACVSGPVVNLSTVQAKPGDEITVTGSGFRLPEKVELRFNALDGPVLATVPKPDNQTISTAFTVPPGTVPGNYVVIVTQTRADGSLALSPVRALLTVVGPSGEKPVLGADTTSDTADRLPALAQADNSIGTGTLLLVALGVAGVGMFAAGLAALASSRRGTTARPVSVKKS